MRPRDSVLVYKETQTPNASTKAIDLDLVDPVSALYLEFEATNGTTSNEDNFISDVITKVEIVDGSEVLYSLTLTELEALAFYKTRQTPTLFPSEWATGVQRHGVYLLFGRKLWDLRYAIDFTRFKNPQLKITWDLAAVRAVDAATAFATGTLKITVIAKVMEETPKPSEYLMAKELLNFTSSATSGAEERKELVTDRVYRLLMTRHWVEGKDIDEISSDLKLTADADKYIAFNRKVQQLDAEALSKFGIGTIKHDILRGNGGTARLIFNKEPLAQLQMNTTALYDIICQRQAFSSQVQIDLATHAGVADGTIRQITMMESGHAIHASLPIPFGDNDDPATWFDPKPYKKLELIFTSGGNAGSCAVVAEQVRAL